MQRIDLKRGYTSATFRSLEITTASGSTYRYVQLAGVYMTMCTLKLGTSQINLGTVTRGDTQINGMNIATSATLLDEVDLATHREQAWLAFQQWGGVAKFEECPMFTHFYRFADGEEVSEAEAME